MAEMLNTKFPDIYKDPNPKPEIAITLSDDFEACIGFADLNLIKLNFQQNPPLTGLLSGFEVGHEGFLKKFCSFLF